MNKVSNLYSDYQIDNLAREQLIKLWQIRIEVQEKILGTTYYAHTHKICTEHKVLAEIRQYQTHAQLNVTEGVINGTKIGDSYTHAIRASRLLAFIQDFVLAKGDSNMFVLNMILNVYVEDHV
jgi:hypothetical protein